MEKILEFIQKKMPLGVMVFDEKMRVVYHNSIANKYLKRYGIVQDLTAVVERMFRERSAAGMDTFSKNISFSGASRGMTNNLSVRYLYSEEPFPRISVFISTKPCNTEMDAEEMIRRCGLTRKEAEIFRLLVRGLKNKDIASELNMEANTVKYHLRSIYTKCGVRSKLDLVRNIIA